MQVVEFEFDGAATRRPHVDHVRACAGAVGREMVVPVAGGGAYRGEVTRCESRRMDGATVYAVWLRRGEYEHGPFLVKELPD